MSKGDHFRDVNKELYDKQFAAIFGDKPKHRCREWYRDEQDTVRCYFCNETQPSYDSP